MFVQRPEAVDVVLTDMMMPIMDGLTAMRTMLNIRPDLPIIAASGLNAYADAGEATAAGARQFLAKPFTAETLLKAVRAVLPDRQTGG
jgi:CheY-like chemotaxis protein